MDGLWRWDEAGGKEVDDAVACVPDDSSVVVVLADGVEALLLAFFPSRLRSPPLTGMVGAAARSAE